MDILQITTDTDRRGGPVFACDLEHELRAHGHDVETVALAPGTDPAPLPLETLGPTRLGRRALGNLRRRARRASLVIAHGSTTLPAAAIATAGLRKPFVYRNIGEPLYWANTRARRIRTGAFLRRAARVVALWDGSADVLVRRFGVSRDRIVVIPTGVPADRWRPVTPDERREARATFRLERADKVAVYVGSLSPEKQVARAIEAVAAIPAGKLLVVGDGPERAALEALARASAPGRVTFAGSRPDPAHALAAADALVLPSRTEGIPAVLIEAGLRGLPVVASAVGGIPAVVGDGTTGYLVPSGDARSLAERLGAVLQNGNGMGSKAREHCLARFDMDTIGRRWDDLIRDLSP